MVAVAALAAGCADDGPDPCALLDPGLPPLHEPDSAARWQSIAAALDGEAADAAAALAVVASQVATLGADATLADRAAVALRPAVAEHLATVMAVHAERCGA